MGWHLHLIKTEGTNVSGEGGGAPDMEAPIPGSTKRGRKGGIHKNEKNGQKGTTLRPFSNYVFQLPHRQSSPFV